MNIWLIYMYKVLFISVRPWYRSRKKMKRLGQVIRVRQKSTTTKRKLYIIVYKHILQSLQTHKMLASCFCRDSISDETVPHNFNILLMLPSAWCMRHEVCVMTSRNWEKIATKWLHNWPGWASDSTDSRSNDIGSKKPTNQAASDRKEKTEKQAKKFGHSLWTPRQNGVQERRGCKRT